ncbi:MAG: ABC transporter ATP-binding protein, partial [Cyclobacteriaceae bacterium]|nr:ABC transporter ATP-binding protein [Cyclobacteriaceae bacterium]
SFVVGLLDGLGLTMFLPLLQVVGDEGTVNATQLGKLDFVINLITNSGVPLTIGVILILMVLFFCLKGLFSFALYYYRTILQENFIQKLRLSTLHGVNELNYQSFVQTENGKILNTLNGEVDRISKAYQSYFLAIQAFIMVMVYIVFAFLVNAQFAVLVSIAGALSNLIYRQIYIRTKGASRKLSGQTDDFQGLISQHLTNYKYLKATATLASFEKRIIEVINSIKTTNSRIGYLMSILIASREPLVIAIVAIIIFIQVSVLGSPMGPILVSLLFFYRALSFLMQMQTHTNHYLSIHGSLGNVTDFLNYLEKNKEKKGSQELHNFQEKLELKGVEVRYGLTPVLKEISLTIKKYETVAFVGESGSGKTTLINTL